MTHDIAKKNSWLGNKLFYGMAYVKCLLESNRRSFSEVKINKKIKCQLYQRINGLQPNLLGACIDIPYKRTIYWFYICNLSTFM